MAQTTMLPNGEYVLTLQRGKRASSIARKLVKKFAPSVEVVYVEKYDPESPVPQLRERFGATYYGLEAIRAYSAHEERKRGMQK